MKFINEVPKKYLYVLLGVLLSVVAVVVFLVYGSDHGDTAETGSKYAYGTYVESKLADDVLRYLSGIDAIDQAAREEIADYSVQNYNAVLGSGTTVVTDGHSEALRWHSQEYSGISLKNMCQDSSQGKNCMHCQAESVRMCGRQSLHP